MQVKIWWLVAASLMISLLWAGGAERTGQVASAKNESDIALQDFSDITEKFLTDLNGEWHLFAHALLTPEEVTHALEQAPPPTATIPGSFAEHLGEANSYATYAVRIRLSDEFIGKRLAIHIPFQYSAYRLYAGEQEIAANGRVGTDAQGHVAEMRSRIGYFVTQSNSVLLTMQVSSFQHIRGGFENPIWLGQAERVALKVNSRSAIDMFMYGSILITGILMILLSWFVRKDRPALYFGIFCVLFFARSLYAVPFYYNQIFLKTSWLWGTRIEYFLTEAVMLMYIMLVAEWYTGPFSRLVRWLSVIALSSLMAITWFTPPVFFQSLFFNVSMFAIPIFFYFLYILIKEVRNKNHTARWNMIGLFVIFIAHLHDYAIGRSWIQSTPIMLPAVFVFVLIHVLILSKNYAGKIQETVRLNKKLTELNASLDQQVHERTRQLQEINEQLQYLASRDSLTGIHNRHSFNAYISNAFRESQEANTALSVIMLDLDEFKKYNDDQGHINGDALLKQIAGLIDVALPQGSFFARYGGEEFVVVLPNTNNEQAEAVASRIRQALEQAGLPHRRSKTGIVTVSAGVATMTSEAPYDSELALLEAADQQLYRAKREK